MARDDGKLTKWTAPWLALVALMLSLAWATHAGAAETNAFPEVGAVLDGHVFTNSFDRDVFFLHQIRARYAAHWPGLLAANITVGDYVIAPEKLERFVKAVGAAGEDSDDPIACASVAQIISDPDFYANTNAWHPDAQRQAAESLIELGPRGRRTLAGAFTEARYRSDPESLEIFADVIGKSGVVDTNFPVALAAAAFEFTATNGGSFPRCTEIAAKNLLGLTNGIAEVRTHLNTNEMLKDPGRFQPIMDAIDAAHADALLATLETLSAAAKARKATLAPGADPYKDDLLDLESRLQRTLDHLRAPGK